MFFRKNRQTRGIISLFNLSYRYLVWGLRTLIVAVLLDIGYMWGKISDIELYERGPVNQSSFIKKYEYLRATDSQLPELRWQPLDIDLISGNLVQAVIVAEDSRFYKHNGFDREAFKKAMEYNFQNYKIVYGGSTISQQMIKNMLLSPSRNPLRKWHELWLTLYVEQKISKQRILEIYLNVVEFGQGIYGAEAAAQYYWGKHASDLTLTEAIELAASLPSPVKHNPQTRTGFFNKQVKKIRKNMRLALLLPDLNPYVT